MSDVSHGSDSPHGPDWWQASDDRWYPGELHPWRQGGPDATQASSAAPYAFYGEPADYIMVNPQRPARRRLSGRMAVAGFAVLLLVAIVGAVVVGVQGGGRPSASRGLVNSKGPAASAHHSQPDTTESVPGPSPTVAGVEPNPTGASPGPSPTAALTTAAVTKVFNQIWPLFTDYASEDYVAGLLSVSTLGASQVVQSEDVCGCDRFWSSYSSLEFTAPVQTSYPLSFLAEVDQKGDPDGPQVQLLVFERKTAAQPWMITYATGYGGTNKLLPGTSNLGSAPLSITPGTTPFGQLATLFQSLRRTGSPPAGDEWDSVINDPGLELTDFASGLTDSYELDQTSGIAVSATFGTDDYSTPFSIAGGSLSCATITAEVTMRPVNGSTMTQTNTSSLFGPLVPPGQYATVTFHEAVDVCVELVASTLEIEGLVGGTYSATWT